MRSPARTELVRHRHSKPPPENCQVEQVPTSRETQTINSMNAIKFSCPGCGQHIECDAGCSGMTTRCPTCDGDLLVPCGEAPEPPPSAHGCRRWRFRFTQLVLSVLAGAFASLVVWEVTVMPGTQEIASRFMDEFARKEAGSVLDRSDELFQAQHEARLALHSRASRAAGGAFVLTSLACGGLLVLSSGIASPKASSDCAKVAGSGDTEGQCLGVHDA